jgi:glycosyltransferase involved in cell wall biosynthesis
MIRVLGLSLYGPQAASTRYRLMQYAPGLRQYGIELDVRGLLGDDYIRTTFAGQKCSPWKVFRYYMERMALLSRQHSYDTAVVQAEMFPLLPGIAESQLLRIPYIYDFDDAFFLKYRARRFRYFSPLLKNKFDAIVSRAAAVTAGNHYLVDYARHWNSKTFLLPTVVDTDRYAHAPNNCDKVFTVGWIGSPSTAVYLSELVQPLAELGREGPTRFVVIGGRCPAIEGVDVVHVPWSEDTEVGLINTFDVGVMPLFKDEWSKGKCALKLIQYMACGVPVVASPVGANLSVVSDDCGFLATGRDEWRNTLHRLRCDAPLRRRMGAAGRKKVEDLYSLRSAVPVMANTIKEVMGENRRVAHGFAHVIH